MYRLIHNAGGGREDSLSVLVEEEVAESVGVDIAEDISDIQVSAPSCGTVYITTSGYSP